MKGEEEEVEKDNDMVLQDRSFFIEKQEVLTLLTDFIHLPASVNQKERERLLEELTKILLRYQEQSHLLGPHIEDLLKPLNQSLITYLLQDKADRDESYLLDICKFIQVCCRVRGFKHIAKHLPHEVHQLEPCCALLAEQDNNDHNSWETRYVLLLWLSSLVLIPFDLSSMDSLSEGSTTLVEKLISTTQAYIGDPGPTREAAGFCLANLLTRPDMETAYLNSFLINAAERLQHKLDSDSKDNRLLSKDYFHYIGILSCLNQIFKRGHRNKLLPLIQSVYTPSLGLASVSVQTVERKLLCKLIQRLGMTFLPPKEAIWRYQRGQRSLNTVLQLPNTTAVSNTESNSNSSSTVVIDTVVAVVEEKQEEEEEEEEVQYSNEIEEIVGVLLSFLSDRDTVVRWSAAKGLGRITMRLPKTFASEIVNAIVGVFEDESSDTNWHGGCLAVAELARRGLLLPDKLDTITKIINKGMHFDILRGQHSVGAHVRDAACYVCWAFARAYSPQHLQLYRVDLFNSMLLTSLFDREVHCRRAASAALQEFVGRQGHEHFTESLTIISIADFFSVGNRSTAFLDVSASIASLDQTYLSLFLDHLINNTFNHWDDDIRALTAKALAKLLMVDPTSAPKRLATLLPSCSSLRLADRHGALLSVSSILLVISKTQVLDLETITAIEVLLAGVDKLRLFRGKGGELVREAVCNVIESLSRSRMKISQKTQVALVEFLNEQLRQPHEQVQRAAQNALRLVLFNFFGDGPILKNPTERLQNITISKYMTTLSTEMNVAVTRGFCLALGVLPERLALLSFKRFNEILDVLASYASSSKKISGDHDAETSRNSIEAVIELTERLCHSTLFTVSHMKRCLNILFQAGQDYSVDKRGDTGSWCRILALQGLERILIALSIRLNRGGQPALPVPLLIKEDEAFKSNESHWVSPFGIGLVKQIDYPTSGCPVVSVSFTPFSLGGIQCEKEKWIPSTWQTSNTLLLPVNPIWTNDPLPITADDTLSISDSEKDNISNENWQTLPIKEIAENIFSLIIKQMAEKLDAVRDIAIQVLSRLTVWYLSSEKHGDSSSISQLVSLLSSSGEKNMELDDASKQIENWIAQSTGAFPVLSQILLISHFFHPVFSGLILSVGGVGKSIAKNASDSLLTACQSQQTIGNLPFFHQVASSILQLFQQHKREDRVILPLLKTIQFLLYHGKIFPLTIDGRSEWVQSIYEVLQVEIKTTSNIPKLIAVIDVLALLLPLQIDNEALSKSLLHGLIKLLAHKYPKVRKHCAESVYLLFLSPPQSLVSLSGEIERSSEIVLSVVWDREDIEAVREATNTILEILGFPILQLSDIFSGRTKASAKKADELDSYEALVREAGY